MNDLTEMWAALERYQPSADAVGHGDSWKRMTTERTADAAWAAWQDAGGVADLAQYSNYQDAADAAHEAAWSTAIALRFAKERDAERYIADAIKCISRARRTRHDRP